MNAVKTKIPAIEKSFTVVCSYCGKLLKGEKYWGKKFFTKHEMHSLPVSHGICQGCLVENFPNEYMAILEENRLKNQSSLTSI